MTHSRRILLGSVALAAVGFTFTHPARATGHFPGLIYRSLYYSYVVPPYQPPCSLCHLRGSTGPGTAETPFALSMKARGLVGGDNASLTRALEALTADKVDSDNDGVPDVQEIENDTDPNTPAHVSLTGESGPNAGCGGGQKAGSRGQPAVALGILSSALLVGLRRRKRRFNQPR